MLGFLRKKDKLDARCSVRIAPWNTVLDLKSGSNLLDAAIAEGLPVPYNCRVGACKTCQIKVLEGRPKSLIEREYVFTRDEIADGMYLACQTKVESDLQIAWPQLLEHASTSKQTALLQHIEQMTSRIYRVQLRLSTAASWSAGQFSQLLPEGLGLEPRCYSMVFGAQNQSLISFDITVYPGGAVSSWLANSDNLGKSVQIELPFGEFAQHLSDPNFHQSPLLCIAGGSGVGAITGIIASYAQLRHRKKASPVVLVVGARQRTEIYGLQELRDLAQQICFPLYIDVVLDREPTDSDWLGRRGYIAEHLPQILADAASYDNQFQQAQDAWKVLLCGPPPMVDSSINSLQQYGVTSQQMTFDKYEQCVT